MNDVKGKDNGMDGTAGDGCEPDPIGMICLEVLHEGDH